MDGEERLSVDKWIQAAAPGWVLLSPSALFGGPGSICFLFWAVFLLSSGPWLSSFSVAAKAHLFLATDAFQVPANQTEVAIAKYLSIRPPIASLLCLAQFFLLSLLISRVLRKRGLTVRLSRLLQWLGLACTPLFLKHLIATVCRLRASSVQSLIPWPTSLIAWMDAPAYTNCRRILLERADLMDLWTLCLFYVAIFWLSGGRRGLALRVCFWVVFAVLARDFVLLGLYRSFTSAAVLDVILQRYMPTIEHLYHM